MSSSALCGTAFQTVVADVANRIFADATNGAEAKKNRFSTHPFRYMRTDCVVPLGLEPSQTEPKPVVLPLHHGTICVVISRTEKGFVMMMWGEASHRHGTRLQVFSSFFAH